MVSSRREIEEVVPKNRLFPLSLHLLLLPSLHLLLTSLHEAAGFVGKNIRKYDSRCRNCRNYDSRLS